MGILNDSVTVFSRLARDFLTLSNPDVLNEAAFEVLLEEFPVVLNLVQMVRKYWRNPN